MVLFFPPLPITYSAPLTDLHVRHHMWLMRSWKSWFHLNTTKYKKTNTPWHLLPPAPQTFLFLLTASDAHQHVSESRDDIPTRENCQSRRLGRSMEWFKPNTWIHYNKKREGKKKNVQLKCKHCLIEIIWLCTIQRKQQGCLSTISENQTMLDCVSFHTVEPAINPWPLFRLRWAEGWPQLWNNKGPVMVSLEACCLNFVSPECVRRREGGRKKEGWVINFSCPETDCANWWQ